MNRCLSIPIPSSVPGPQGFMGAPGPTGATGATGSIGPAGIVWLGAWNPNTSYVAGNAVSLSGVDWIAINPNTNIIPGTNSVFWSLFVQGPTGPMGASPIESVSAGYGSNGSSFNLATSLSFLNLSPNPPSVLLTTPGTYLLSSRIKIDVSGTYDESHTLLGETLTFALYDTVAASIITATERQLVLPNYSGDSPPGSPLANLPVTVAELTLPVVPYVYAGGSGHIQVWGKTSAQILGGFMFLSCADADVQAILINL